MISEKKLRIDDFTEKYVQISTRQRPFFTSTSTQKRFVVLCLDIHTRRRRSTIILQGYKHTIFLEAKAS